MRLDWAEKIPELRELAASGLDASRIAARFSVSQHSVRNVCRRYDIQLQKSRREERSTSAQSKTRIKELENLLIDERIKTESQGRLITRLVSIVAKYHLPGGTK